METVAEETWYDQAFQDFITRLTLIPKTVEYFQQLIQQHPDIGKVQSMLSVGPARGNLDTKLLSLFRSLTHYTGLEPDPDSLQHLRKAMSDTDPDIQTDVHQCTLQQWPGSADNLDLVFLCHVLYYVTDQQTQIKRCLDMVKPGGFVIVVLADDNSVAKMGRRFNVTNAHDKHYCQPELRQHLSQLNLQHCVLSEGRTTFTCDFRNKTQHLANFYLQKQADVTEAKDLFSCLDGMFPEELEMCHDFVTVLRKPKTTSDI